MESISFVKMCVLWNGNKGEYFETKKGLRQGYLISPYVFVLCIDKLSHMIIEQVEEGRCEGAKAGKSSPTVSCLMFADDLILFGRVVENQITCIMEVLDKYYGESGQRISYDKSRILFSKSTDVYTRRKIIQFYGIKEAKKFGYYLGVPLTGKFPKAKDYQYLVDPAKTKLSSWRGKQLSFAGRLTLAKSVLKEIPTYTMMSNMIPNTFFKNI
ncbi:unnamed protein product [Lathyrus sativus]|nr:unnamed protein product [Lathyrus sativus]